MSPSSRVVLQPAYLLHRRPYRESSLLVEFLTNAYGRVSLIAKGVRKAKNRPAGLLQPFVPVHVSWTGKSDLPVLVGVECRSDQQTIRARTLLLGLYLNELLYRLLAPRDPHPEIFALYESCLQQMAEGHEPDRILRGFELSLLEELGYGLSLDRDVETGQALQPDRYYRYLADRGLVEAPPGTDAFRGATLLALKNRALRGTAELSEAKRLLRPIIARHLGDRPLKSRELFKYPLQPE